MSIDRNRVEDFHACTQTCKRGRGGVSVRMLPQWTRTYAVPIPSVFSGLIHTSHGVFQQRLASKWQRVREARQRNCRNAVGPRTSTAQSQGSAKAKSKRTKKQTQTNTHTCARTCRPVQQVSTVWPSPRCPWRPWVLLQSALAARPVCD